MGALPIGRQSIKEIADIPHIKKLISFLNLVGYRVSSAWDVWKTCFKYYRTHFAVVVSQIAMKFKEIVTCIISILVLKNWVFEDYRKSDVGKTTKIAPSEQTKFSRYLSPKIIKIGQELGKS